MRSSPTAIVWLAVALKLVSSQNCRSSNTSCQFPAVCKRIAIDETGLDIRESPFYDQVTYDSASVDLDNVCTTYFYVGKDTYLACMSHVYSNGSFLISKLIVSAISEFHGVFRWQGKTDSTDEIVVLYEGCSSAVFNDYTLQNLQSGCEGIIVLYRCFIYGKERVQRYGREDTVVGYSSCPIISDECARRIQIAAQSSCLNLGTFNRLPNRFAKRCVIKVGNANAINACSVSTSDAYEM